MYPKWYSLGSGTRLNMGCQALERAIVNDKEKSSRGGCADWVQKSGSVSKCLRGSQGRM